MKRLSWLTLVAALLGAAVFAFGMVSRQAPPRPDRPVASTAQPIDEHAGHDDIPGDALSTRAFKEANERLHQSMNIPWSGDPDIDFMRVMIAQHQGAIALARIEMEKGSDADARGVAEELIRTRESEIVRIRLWMARREAASTTSPGD